MQEKRRLFSLEIRPSTSWEEVKDQLEKAQLNHFEQHPEDGDLIREFVGIRQTAMEGRDVVGLVASWYLKAEGVESFLTRRDEAIRAITQATRRLF